MDQSQLPLLSHCAARTTLAYVLQAWGVRIFARERVGRSGLCYVGGAVALVVCADTLPLAALLGSCALCYGIFANFANAPCPSPPSFRGRVAIVTGSSSGIGEEVATMLLKLGATVIFACRSKGRAEDAIARCLRRSAAPASAARFVPLDLCDGAAVRAFAQRVCSEYPTQVRNCEFLCYSLRLRLAQRYVSIYLYIV